MVKSALAVLLAALGPLRAFGFSAHTVQSLQQQHEVASRQVHLSAHLPDRRSFLTAPAASAAALLAASLLPQPSHAASGKVVVFGGSGYVGSYVDELLSSAGYAVVSVARSSSADQAAKVSKNLGSAPGNIEYVSLDAASDDLGPVLKGAAAVVSCIGTLGSGAAVRAANGATNARIAAAAKSAGAGRFVYVSVASELANGPARFVLGDYVKGKAEAEAAVTAAFGGGQSLLVKPAIIDGAPPGEIRPPGPPGMKGVAVKSVAKAVVAGVTGEKSGAIDGNAAISGL